MKKSLIALAVLTVSSAAFAQSSVTISGGMQVGVMDTGAAGAKAAVAHLGNGMNAININSNEDLGGGLRGGFSSQMRYNAATGDMNSSSGGGTALFHALNVHLSGGFGTIRAGKIIEAGHCAFDPWACGGGASLQAGVGTSVLVASGTQANSIAYVTPTFNGFSAGYQTSVSTRTDERTVLNVGYAKGPLALSFVRAENSSASGAAAFTSTLSQQQSVAAGYTLGFGRVTVVNTKTENAAGVTTNDVTSLGLSAPMGAYTLLAGYNKDSKAAANADTKTVLGANYALSKRTTLGADVFKAEAAGAGTGFVVRMRHTF